MRLRDLIRAVENKYNRLLAILTLLYLTSPFLLDWVVGNVVFIFIFFGAIILATYQIQHSRSTLILSVGLVLLTFVLRILSEAPFPKPVFNHFFSILTAIGFLLFLALATYLILRELIVSRQITADTIKGGICVYFLFGFSWVSVYNLVYAFDPNSFSGPTDTLTRADLIHFSFVTLTTVGYGDILPRSEIARVLANLEAMVGVMYPAVFIARLVGLHGTR
jgi:hypothetical protein